jgi:AcrR family transcriptional regulator
MGVITLQDIPDSLKDCSTKDMISLTALELFAKKGYASVSMRDISGAVGIQIASIYYYFHDKVDLLENIFFNINEEYKRYFEWLSEMNFKAETLEEVMDNIFNEGFLAMQNKNICFGISLAIKEQFNHEIAQKSILELFLKYSTDQFKAVFDKLIEKGIIPPSDTNAIAFLLIYCIIAINDMRNNLYFNNQQVNSCTVHFINLKRHITGLLKNGC